MKRIVVLLCALASVATATAQWGRPRNTPENMAGLPGVEYHNFAVGWQAITLRGETSLVYAPVTRGLAFTTGHSFLIHETPLLRTLHFGFDVTWFDIEYGHWRKKIDGNAKWLHKLDMAIGAGPAIHLSPFGRLGVHLYFHYNPTLSTVAHNFAGDEEGKFELVAGYASYFSSGLAISWSAFSVGGEYRHGGGVYRGIRIPDLTVTPDNIDELLQFRLTDVLDRHRHRMKGWRAYIAFRF
jgi:hypothetical protein